MRLAESTNKWVERMAVREGLSPLSRLICEIVISVGQGNFKFVGEFQKSLAVATMIIITIVGISSIVFSRASQS